MGGRLARAVAAAAIVIAVTGCDMILGPAQTDTNWHTYDRGHFTFYVRPNSFAERSVDTLDAVLNDQFAVSVAALQLKYSGHIAMFLHNTGSEAGFGDDPGGGARLHELTAADLLCHWPPRVGDPVYQGNMRPRR